MCGSTEEADEDVSADDFMAMFHEVLMDMLGGVSFKEMFTGMSPRELKEMPPFPFPRELFPQGRLQLFLLPAVPLLLSAIFN